MTDKMKSPAKDRRAKEYSPERESREFYEFANDLGTQQKPKKQKKQQKTTPTKKS